MSKNNSQRRVFISNFDSALHFSLKKLENLIGLVFKFLKIPKASVSLVFVTDSEIKKLNQEYLGHSWPTDVLAFPLKEFSRSNKKSDFLGEIIISPKRAVAQCRNYKTTFENELARYVIHGILHLNGYTDKNANDFERMHAKEDAILKKNLKLIKGLFRYGHPKR